MSHSGYVQIHVTKLLKETDKAFLLEVKGKEVWIAKSLIPDWQDYLQDDEKFDLSIPDWVAEENGLECKE